MDLIKKLVFIFLLGFLFLCIGPQLYIIKASYVFSPWSQSLNLPYNLANHTAFSINNKLFIVDGSGNFGGSHDEVLRASISNDGSLSAWEVASILPRKLIWHSNAISDSKIYILGGYLDNIDGFNENINSVYLNSVDNQGNFNSWQGLNPLPETLSLGSATIYNNRIYYAGGVTDAHSMYQTAKSEIYKADINLDGTIGSWSLAGYLSYPNFGQKITTIGNYLFEFGGYGTDSSWHVRRATIESDGTIGSWEEQPYFPHGLAMFGLLKINNLLVVIGGDEAGQTNIVRYSEINPDNTISPWTNVNPTSFLPNFIGNNAVANFGNYIYSIGGYNSTDGYLNSVYYSNIQNLSTPTPTPTFSPSPSPSPSPSLSPTTSPSPTQIPVKKIFFAPGLGGSWNLDAIINCKLDGYSGEWKLAPYAKNVYQPFFDAINSTNWKLNTFYYDWRKDVRDNAKLLNNTINLNTEDKEKVNFIGHSMGGLVGRSYMEQQNGGKLNSYYSIGTPHQGAVSAYQIANGYPESNNLIQKIAETIYLKRCGIFASSKNILPTFDYLKNSKTNQIKLVSQMNLKNNYLTNNFSYPYWGVKIGTLSGQGFDTEKYLKVTNNLFWSDGKPMSTEYNKIGDGTVLLSSSQIENASVNTIITQSHSGIIGTTEGVNKVLEFLGTPPVDDPPFVEPKSALVLIGSNGNFWIKDKNGKMIQSDQGVIAIINPETSDFDLKYIPQKGSTLIIVAQFLPNGDVKYKEYKHWGYPPFTKKVHFNREHPKEDICSDR